MFRYKSVLFNQSLVLDFTEDFSFLLGLLEGVFLVGGEGGNSMLCGRRKDWHEKAEGKREDSHFEKGRRMERGLVVGI